MSEFFKYGEGKEVNFEQFKTKVNDADIKQNKVLKKILNIFDKNQNGEIEEDEAFEMFDSFRKAAKSNNNLLLEDSEVKELLTQNNIKASKSMLKSISNFFASITSDEQETLQQYEAQAAEFTEEEVEELAVQQVSEDVQKARQMFDTQRENQGAVSDFVDGVKETFHTEYAASKVERVIKEEELSAQLLQLAQEGKLTEREYLERKLALAKSLLPPPQEDSYLSSLAKNLLPFISIPSALVALGIDISDDVSDEEKEQLIKIQILENALKNLKPEELNVLITNASQAENSEEQNEILNNLVDNYLSNFDIKTHVGDISQPKLVGYKDSLSGEFIPYKEGETLVTRGDSTLLPVYDNITEHKQIIQIEQKNPTMQADSVGQLISARAEKLKSFEETFRDERGVEYDAQKIEDYARKNAQMQFVLSSYNKITSLKQDLNHSLVGLGTADAQRMSADVLYPEKVAELNSAVISILSQLNKGDKKAVEKILSDICNRDVKLTETKIKISDKDITGISSDLRSDECKEVAKYLEKILDNKMEQVLNGKTLEEYAEETSAAYKTAYGNKDISALAEGYVQSQQEGVQTVKSTIQTGAMLVMIAGQLVPVAGQVAAAMTMGGLVTSTVGGTVVQGIEDFTKKGGATKEDKQAMIQELGTSIALVASGMKIGKVSESAFRLLVIKNCPKLLAFASEVGIDATMSLVADAVITGQVDLSGEGIAQLQNILVGIIRAKGNFKTYMNTHAGELPTQSQLESSASKGINEGAGTKPATTDVPKGKLNDVREASATNPAENAGVKSDTPVGGTEVKNAVISSDADGGFKVKIGEQEFKAKTIEEATEIVNKNAPKGINVEFENITTKDDLISSDTDTKAATETQNGKVEANPIRELSDAEFEALKLKLQKNPNYRLVIDEGLDEYAVTRETAQIVDLVLKTPELLNNKNITTNLMDLLLNTNTHEQTQLLFELLKKPELFEKLSADNLCSLVSNTFDEAKLGVALYVTKNSFLFEMKDFSDIVSGIHNNEDVILRKQIIDLLGNIKENNPLLWNNSNFKNNVIKSIQEVNSVEQFEIAKKIIENNCFWEDKNISNYIPDFIASIETPEQFELAKCLTNEIFASGDNMHVYSTILSNSRNHDYYQNVKQTLCFCDEMLQKYPELWQDAKMSFLWEMLRSNNLTEQMKIKEQVISCLDEMVKNNPELLNNKNFTKQIGRIIQATDTPEKAKIKQEVINKIFSDEKLYNNENLMNNLGDILEYTNTPEQVILANKIFSDEKLYNNENLMNNLGDIIVATNEHNIALAERLCTDKELNIDPKRIPLLLEQSDEISTRDVRKVYKALGQQQAAELSDSEFTTVAKFIDIYGKTNINEIPISAKRGILRRLVAANTDLFNTSQKLQEMFPLLPKDAESYCTLLPALVRSIGVETNTLKPEQVDKFNIDLQELSNSLVKLSDTEFSNLEISQEYSTKAFTLAVLDKVKDLSSAERQKVYDYFGFELHRNKNNETGYSIVGYPVNLNNGKKLAQITDPKTKDVVESLRPEVVRFSEQNPIKCDNAQVEQFMNEIVKVLPELRTTIGRKQHGSQDFDVMQHSLKVMQKISQDPKFEELGDSDKKIMMLAALMHDITKLEGFRDRTHSDNGSFDSFFIAKKFNLSRDEEIKLYTLIRNHEWLEHANTSKSEEMLTKRLHDIAYDLRHDNVFDMLLMFTHADLRAVKTDDSFHDSTVGKSRIDFNGNVRSFGNSADVYAERIRGYIDELKTSQPILPVTKFPAASTISHRITQVNPDGSTNIKGVYKNNEGLVIIKYNEVEDWEALGFPKGTDSRGIMAKGLNGAGQECDVETGNIKFFVHGLDYENQLTKFDAFGLIDSDALLSVSYAERPESKYGFFRTQGVILDVDTKYVHGGGNTDAGSGCGKSIQCFKDNYIFGGNRESDRLYISNMVKEATGMNDAEYVEFVKANENKSMLEIEPAEIREKIIKAFATINSNTRKGNREYNEMYASNPRVMGVFAYSPSRHVGNIMEFVGEQKDFLKKYAIKEDLPFVVFGD